MGVARVVAYGVLVTDEFGEAFEEMRELHDAIGDPYKSDPWLVSCPSAESPQLVVGIEANIEKNTDFSALQAQWEEAIAKAPAQVQALANEWEPDVCFLAGKN